MNQTPLVVRVVADYANFRRSFARSYAESYLFAPPSTVYGMLLSLVGEYNSRRHLGVRFAFAYRDIPQKARTMHKLTRYKYGVANKQAEKGNCPENIETVCDLDFLVAIDSERERWLDLPRATHATLAERVRGAIEHPESVNRRGLLSLGLSDSLVNVVEVYKPRAGDRWFWLSPSPTGTYDLPIWVDHGSSSGSRWLRFDVDEEPRPLDGWLASDRFAAISAA